MKMQIQKGASLAMAAVLMSTALAVAQSSPPAPPANAPAQKSVQQDPGERKFRANCGRCHGAPEQLTPRIAGTVLRHMRVRATLSAQDEKDILRYLAP